MKRFFAIIITLLVAHNASAWSGAIHSGIAAIADANLTADAKSAIDEALEGHSIIYYAHWMDDVADSETHKHTKSWHNVAITPKNVPLSAKKAAKSKVKGASNALALEGLVTAINALTNRSALTTQQVADNIRYIVSIVCDLHCPPHYIFTDTPAWSDVTYTLAGNKHTLKYSAFWEYSAIRHTFIWKTQEFVHQLSRKSPEQVAALTAGSITDWVSRNAEQYRVVLGMMESGAHFNERTFRLWNNKIYPISTEIVATAGYRLAAILNSLFDEKAPRVKTK